MRAIYNSPLGEIAITSDEIGITSLLLRSRLPSAENFTEDRKNGLPPAIANATAWLDEYFSGGKPQNRPPLHLIGTLFQLKVWELLLKVPYGQTTTYGKIAREIAKQRQIPTMSARAVGRAVGRNPILIIVPCHRVIAANNALGGFGMGIEAKIKLLKIEGIQVRQDKKKIIPSGHAQN